MNRSFQISIVSVPYIASITFALLGVEFGFWDIVQPVPFYKLAFGCVLLYYLLVLCNKFVKKTRSQLMICVFIATLAFAFLVFYQQDDQPLNLLTFVGCFMLMHASIVRPISIREFKIIKVVMVMGSIIFSAAFLTQRESWWGLSLTLADFNPQAIGAWAMIFSMALLLNIDSTSNRFMQILFWILYGYMGYITILTESRASLIIWMAVSICRILPMTKMLYNDIVARCSSWIPAFVVLISILMFFFGIRDSNGNTFLNDRELLWLDALGESLTSPLIGLFVKEGGIYSHNNFVDYIYMFGIPLTIAFFTIMGNSFSKKLHQASEKSRLNYDAFCIFMGCEIMCSMESLIFSTGAGGMFIIVFWFLQAVGI